MKMREQISRFEDARRSALQQVWVKAFDDARLSLENRYGDAEIARRAAVKADRAVAVLEKALEQE